MAAINNGLKGILMRGLEAVNNTASSIASNTKYKVDEMNLLNRRREILSDFGARAYEIWQKGDQRFPDELEKLLVELSDVDNQLNEMRSEHVAALNEREEKKRKAAEEKSARQSGAVPVLFPIPETPAAEEAPAEPAEDAAAEEPAAEPAEETAEAPADPLAAVEAIAETAAALSEHAQDAADAVDAVNESLAARSQAVTDAIAGTAAALADDAVQPVPVLETAQEEALDAAQAIFGSGEAPTIQEAMDEIDRGVAQASDTYSKTVDTIMDEL